MSALIPEILFCKETSNSIAECVLLAQAVPFYSSFPSILWTSTSITIWTWRP